jgi:predicted transcriptional regulator
MTDVPLEPGEDVNEAVRADWKEGTTPFERVRAVMKRTYEPQSADEIANRALTTSTTARKHLAVLVEDGFVSATSEPGRSATLYRRSAESLVMEQARDILREMGTEELASRISELQSAIKRYREETGVDSPEDVALEDVETERGTIQEWQTTRRNLDIAKAALAIGQAEDSVETTPAD